MPRGVTVACPRGSNARGFSRYTIELEDDEEFDITKLQLVKSDYEHELFPYFIIADYIIYDGKEIGADAELWDYGIDGKYCNIETIEKLL